MHKDVTNFEMNCAMPWGEFTGGNVVLTELEEKVEVRVGCVFLLGECALHILKTQ